jgi:broad specificity phosphatase PhoE
VAIQLVYETHSISEDNDRGIATGWLPGRLSPRGIEGARALGQRRADDGIDAVFSSDLRRAAETAAVAFETTTIPILHDWRLRECDYGEWNGRPADEVHGGHRRAYLDRPYPSGESWRQAVARVERFLDDLPMRWAGCRVVVIGHAATWLALEHLLNGVALEDVVDAPFTWQEGWEYEVPD